VLLRGFEVEGQGGAVVAVREEGQVLEVEGEGQLEVEVGGAVVEEPDITVSNEEGGEDEVWEGVTLVFEWLEFEVF